MSIKLSDSIRVGQQKPLEDKYFNELVPYISITQVNTLLPKAVRHIGLTVNINGEEYWYKDGIEDEDLIFKSNQKTIEVTRNELDDLIANDELEPNRLYKITGVESWCFSQHLIKAIYLKAISNNTLETAGFGEFYNVNYGLTSVWAGNLLEAGLIDSLEYAVDDLVIWGNLLWTNISGAVGTNLKYFGENLGDIGLPNYLSESDWLPLTPQESGGYNLSIDIIKYDIENNYISYREDTLGNKYEQSFSNLVVKYPNYEIVDFDESYRYYVGAISLFHWGEPDTVYGNTIKDSLVLNCNISSQSLLHSSFYNNTFENSLFYDNLIISSSIRNNRFLNSYFLSNHLKGSSVESNEYNKSYFTSNRLDSVVFGNNTLLKQSNFENNVFRYISVGFNTLNSSYIVNNNLKSPNQGSDVRLYKNTLYDSSIQSNMYYIDITFNTLNNGSSIANNIDNEITVYNRISTITKNNLDNGSTINSNNFVEEGKAISGYNKGINDNILNNTCNINNNTIKNGSRIFGHKLEYYSTINGNTLDTESNIYNNQLIQNGKIDNNILTGHGRIYGNQLDIRSEITNCKLRIYPTTSYSTTIKGNRLFTGKIQNIDFGNIVNPEGTNPNDPAFSGNALSECIIENFSVIKDLTFPNIGGKYIQFVRLTGFNEFKNITVNNSIRNVDFTNTIFNETSDYSKLIEGNGFTKTYIDGVLLQDRFDEKQDVLNYTPENVANKSDSYTASSSTTYASTKALVDGLATKLDKGAYTETAQDLKNEIEGKANTAHTHNISDVSNLQTSLNNKQDNLQTIVGNVGIGTTSPSEKLEVDGNIKATSFIKSGGTSNQFLMADGNTNTYGTTAGTVAEGNHTHTFTSITSKPTTLSGYGITDGINTSDVVTTATANKILKLDANAKLPTSITGNADGNAATATKLQTARTINGVSFDGSADITINAGTNYTLPTASATVLGGVKIGSGISIDGNGVISANTFTPGTENRLAKFSGSTLTNSIIYDDGTSVGIGSTSPLGKLHVVQNDTSAVAAIIQGGLFGALIQGGSAISNYALSVTNSSSSSLLYVRGDGNVGIGTGSPSYKLDVNGNVKATQIKDQYGTLKSQRVITITGDIILSETHNGAILHVTNTCNITIPTGLDANFQCVAYAKGSIIVTFVNGGVTINSPSGLLLKTDKMASLFASASNTFNLLGELATS